MVAISHRPNGIHVSLCFNNVSLSTKCWLIRQDTGGVEPSSTKGFLSEPVEVQGLQHVAE